MPGGTAEERVSAGTAVPSFPAGWSFIDDIESDTKAREIVKFLIGLCKTNEMEVIAEGVDNKEQVEILRKNKCDTIQGFYYSKPLSKQEFEKFLLNNPFEKKEAGK